MLIEAASFDQTVKTNIVLLIIIEQCYIWIYFLQYNLFIIRVESFNKKCWFEMEIFINVFTVTFNQFNYFLLNKSFNKKKILLAPNFWTVVYFCNQFQNR